MLCLYSVYKRTFSLLYAESNIIPINTLNVVLTVFKILSWTSIFDGIEPYDKHLPHKFPVNV